MPAKKKTPKRSNKTTKQPAGFMQKLQLKFGKNLYPALALIIGLVIGASGYYIYQQNYSGAGGKKTVKLYIFSDNGRFDKVSINSKGNTKPCFKASYPLSGKKRAGKSGHNPIEANCQAGNLGFQFIKNNRVLNFYNFDDAKPNKCYLVHASGVNNKKVYDQVGKKCVGDDKDNEPDNTNQRPTNLTIKANKPTVRSGPRITFTGILSSNEELSKAECSEAASKMRLNARFLPQRNGEVYAADPSKVPVKMSYKKGVCKYSFRTGVWGESLKEYTNISFATDFAGTENLAPSVSPALTLKVDKK